MDRATIEVEKREEEEITIEYLNDPDGSIRIRCGKAELKKSITRIEKEWWKAVTKEAVAKEAQNPQDHDSIAHITGGVYTERETGVTWQIRKLQWRKESKKYIVKMDNVGCEKGINKEMVLASSIEESLKMLKKKYLRISRTLA